MKKPAIIPLALEWRISYNDSYRVWRTDWSGDQFEVINEAEFDNLNYFCRLFNIPIKETDDHN